MRIATFGEAMLRMSPPADSSLEKADRYSVEVAGTEANVAVALARLGLDVTWASRLPANALGRRVVGRIRQHGVDTSHVQWADDGRVGLYFVETGWQPRLPTVIYDRAGSAIARMEPEDLDLSLLDGRDHLHLTGITPALSLSCRRITEILLGEAERRSLRISFDVNYRAKLWSPEQARHTLEGFLSRVTLLFVSSMDAAVVLGVEGEPEEQVRELAGRYPQAVVILTCGPRGAWAWDGRLHSCPAVPVEEVDRIGRGDAFCAGYLFGELESGVDFGLTCGTALAALAQTYAGDLTWSTREDLLALANQAPTAHYR